MDIFLGKVTQQAMNYAIRSGITITAGYALKQSSRLLKNVQGNAKEELQALQERLDSKIRIISPAIDMIELISARGNTSLESAVSLTKSLRWDIQTLGQRLATAATAEELARRRSSKAKSREQNELELKHIVQDIRKLLNRIEDAVPLINLAITTSGASLSANLPSTISPSRLLQASTFLTAGDTQYSMKPSGAVQIGPAFTLSMYMLFLGHLRPQNEEDVRESTWKEVIHKARVKLVRVPLDTLYLERRTHTQPTKEYGLDGNCSSPPLHHSVEDYFPPEVKGDAKADEYAYQLVVIEDLDDDRMHTFDDTEAQPGPCDDVEMAGIREILPIHEISKIFYADTGKILNIGSEGEANSPVLLLKRDINAIPPRRMMERSGEDRPEDYADDSFAHDDHHSGMNGKDRYQHQADIAAQLDREHRSSSLVPLPSPPPHPAEQPDPWRIPADLDPEWIAFEVYTEAEDSDTESISDSDISLSHPSRPSREPSLDPKITTTLSQLNLNEASSPPTQLNHASQLTMPQSTPPTTTPTPSLPPIRTSLSLLETLLRLSSLQQFQQQSHLTITDELLNFFLSDSNASTTGAGADSQERKRMRGEARRRVGFDPYDESPVKRRGEEYQYQYQHNGEGSEGEQYAQDYERYGNPRYGEGYEGPWTTTPLPPSSHPISRHQSRLSQSHPPSSPSPPLLLKNATHSSSRGPTPDRSTPPVPSSASYIDNRPFRSPSTPSGMSRARPGVLKKSTREAEKKGSPLARPGTGLTDEGLGTSPGSGFVGGEEGDGTRINSV